MTKQELIEKLKELQAYDDPEHQHILADRLLLEFINDAEVTEEYTEVPRWYA